MVGDRIVNEGWAQAFVMYVTGHYPTPSTDEGIRNLCNLRLDAIDVLAARLNGDPIPRLKRSVEAVQPLLVEK